MERNFVGYGNKIPKFLWLNGARIAVNFVVNYEEGAERSVLEGDSHSECYLTDLPGAVPLEKRHLSVESLFEYGSRTGVWRLLSLFQEIPITIFASGQALERNPPLAEALRHSPHEIAGHGYRWIDYGDVPREVEKEHIEKTIAIIKQLTGKGVKGWYTGRKSPNTRALIQELGLKYDSDSYADDLPYYENKHLIIPYSLDTNDFRYGTCPGWNSGKDFFTYLKASFDCLYREGSKMMTVGLHPRLSGRPGRSEAIRYFIDYIHSFKDVWICRREEIADYWSQNVRS